MTVSEKIGVGRIEEARNPSRHSRRFDETFAAKVIQKLPKGYDQLLACASPTGSTLSGGEWQKIALARAYLRDAQLLILDEPTATLDARAEHEVFQRFAELTHGKISLLISHRFSTVRMADRILVIARRRECLKKARTTSCSGCGGNTRSFSISGCRRTDKDFPRLDRASEKVDSFGEGCILCHRAAGCSD